MEKKEIIDALTLLYNRRLKALLCYRDETFTRKLVEYMFLCFDKITADKKYNQPCFSNEMQKHLCTVLQYDTTNGSNSANGKEACRSLALLLESYYSYILDCFWPEKRKEKADNSTFDSRTFLSKQFEKVMELTPSVFPLKKGNFNDIKSLQIHAIHLRNQKAHPRAGYTSICDRYLLLNSFDIVLTYLLYTFYYLTFTECKKNNPEILYDRK